MVRSLGHMTGSAIKRELRDWGCSNFNRNGKRGLDFPPLPELRRLFEKRYGPQDWENPELEHGKHRPAHLPETRCPRAGNHCHDPPSCRRPERPCSRQSAKCANRWHSPAIYNGHAGRSQWRTLRTARTPWPHRQSGSCICRTRMNAAQTESIGAKSPKRRTSTSTQRGAHFLPQSYSDHRRHGFDDARGCSRSVRRRASLRSGRVNSHQAQFSSANSRTQTVAKLIGGSVSAAPWHAETDHPPEWLHWSWRKKQPRAAWHRWKRKVLLIHSLRIANEISVSRRCHNPA